MQRNSLTVDKCNEYNETPYCLDLRLYKSKWQ